MSTNNIIKLKLLLPTSFIVPYGSYPICSEFQNNVMAMDIDRLRRETPNYDKTKVSRYLRNGYPRSMVMTDLMDPFTHEYISNDYFRMDGVWFWSECLAPYVEKYNIHLPKSFLEYMESKRWSVYQSLADCDFDETLARSYYSPVRLLTREEFGLVMPENGAGMVGVEHKSEGDDGKYESTNLTMEDYGKIREQMLFELENAYNDPRYEERHDWIAPVPQDYYE